MEENIHHNPFKKDDTSNNSLGDSNRKRGSLVPVSVVVALLIISLTIISGLSYMLFISSKKDDSSFRHTPAVTELKSKSIDFCNYFFNLSYTTFKDARTKAEDYMTSNFLTEYKELFYNSRFSDRILNEGVLTTNYVYNQLVEGVYKGKPAVKVIGLIKYSSTKTNVSDEMPITAVLVWVKDNNGIWKVDNVLVEM
jgi:hypothetical protein